MWARTTTGRAREWDRHIAEFTRLAGEAMQDLYRRNPADRRADRRNHLPAYPTHPDLVVWPESPAPFFEDDPRFQQALRDHRPADAGAAGGRQHRHGLLDRGQAWHDYNSALIVGADGARVGRYDKIHLVPFGEYIPFQNLLIFAHKLTGRVSEFTRGDERKVFRLPRQRRAHRYGVFICYEAVFADEVRQFARNWAPRCWSTSATTDGTATPAPPGST